MASFLRNYADASTPSPSSSSYRPTTGFLHHHTTPNFCAFATLRRHRSIAIKNRASGTGTPDTVPIAAEEPACTEAESPKAEDPAPSPSPQPLRVGIVGFGNFGQFIAKGIQRQGHTVLATSRSDYSDYCAQHGIRFFRSVEELCEERPDVVVICSSIMSTERVVRTIPFEKLGPDAIVADVLSVKEFPRNLFLEILPPGLGIVCTHPMFGPESGKHGWNSLPFVYDKVRVAENSAQATKCDQFLSIFEQEGCRMVEMSCAEHDRHAAGSQFITHTIGRILALLKLKSTPINTKGYETLLQLTENTISDSFDLYYGLFMYNVNATEQIDNLERAFDTVKQMLFGRLHDILRKQIVERIPMEGFPAGRARETTTQANANTRG